jgi:hypothetical protein
MNTALASGLLSLIGGGLGAGIITFALNFWKAERDFRRTKLEDLYLALHKYTETQTEVTVRIQMNQSGIVEELRENMEHADQIELLINLYFPSLRSALERFRAILEAMIVKDGEFNVGDPEFPAKFLRLCDEAKKLKQEIVELSRSDPLLSFGQMT